ncbi:unnamed protein product, partial [Polarella glacialis]
QKLPENATREVKQPEDYKRPEWFICPMSSCILSGGQVEVPFGVEMAWEVELGIVISRACSNVSKEEAMDYVGGYVTVLDMTALSLGFEQMKYGLSWTRNKVQATWKPIGRFIKKSEIEDPHAVTLVCKVNGKEVARDSTALMKFSIAEQIADASALTPLQRGDVLLTGAGSLGPLKMGDEVEGFIEGLDVQYMVRTKLTEPKDAR